ncbi:MAG TPA: rRNA maturation RNase YbeY [Gemmatimonadales bacterium]|nr:rRNA maturation RNase YbeY [Gemmatimonadales bacterium]
MPAAPSPRRSTRSGAPEGGAALALALGGRLPLPEAELRRIVGTVVAAEGARAEISLTFLGREAMRRLNLEHKGRDRPTDVLSWSLPDPRGFIVGDVYVCPWAARQEAAARGIPAHEELVRLVVHGTLHALGWDHPEEAGRTRSPMWRRQERYVRRLAPAPDGPARPVRQRREGRR